MIDQSSRVKEIAFSSYIYPKRSQVREDFVIENLRVKKNNLIESQNIHNSCLTYNGALDSLAELKREVRREIKRSKYI